VLGRRKEKRKKKKNQEEKFPCFDKLEEWKVLRPCLLHHSSHADEVEGKEKDVDEAVIMQYMREKEYRGRNLSEWAGREKKTHGRALSLR